MERREEAGLLVKKPPVDGGGRSRQLGPIARGSRAAREEEAAGGEGLPAGREGQRRLAEGEAEGGSAGEGERRGERERG